MAETDWGLVELFDPKIRTDGALEVEFAFLQRPDGEPAFFSTEGNDQVARNVLTPRLFIDSASLLRPNQCQSDAQCEGSQVCSLQGQCELQSCDPRNPSICVAGETCDPVAFDRGWCVTLAECTTQADCESDRICGAPVGGGANVCRLKPCFNTSECNAATEECRVSETPGVSGFCVALNAPDPKAHP